MARRTKSEEDLIREVDDYFKPVNIFELCDEEETVFSLLSDCPTKGMFAKQLGVRSKAVCIVSKVSKLSKKKSMELLFDKIHKGYVLFINSERQAKFYNVEDEYLEYHPYGEGEMYLFFEDKKYSKCKACWYTSYKYMKYWVKLSE